jgi:Uma2 family endonuclease
MQVMLPDNVTFEFRFLERPLDEDEFFELCAKNPKLRIERDTDGEVIVMPPTGFETGCRNNEINFQLVAWARVEGRGLAPDSSTVYLLPNGAARGPDASWVLKSRLAKFSAKQMKRFLPVCPDFVVELSSPTDRLKKLKVKMHEWIGNGAALGWLIDADRRTVYVFRPGKEPEELVDLDHIDGEGPVQGFRLELSAVWQSF